MRRRNCGQFESDSGGRKVKIFQSWRFDQINDDPCGPTALRLEKPAPHVTFSVFVGKFFEIVRVVARRCFETVFIIGEVFFGSLIESCEFHSLQ